ncbi:MAG: hypothetical protein Q8L60_15875 [Gammaproteobacteria bacterium]|nr:hypothetical protein [Gammaproteobacteria bacterium]MDP2141487.1 hypothetical protein [Gammaproteobacteria bacterium]MDP2347488.1 hypothetical protein [Gammaproteobacteria bacterium]
MYLLHQLAFYLHVSIGALALIVFWIPMLNKKGSLDHKRFGRYFAIAMYAVSISGLLMSFMDLLFPFVGHLSPQNDAARSAVASEIRQRAVFLFSLSVLVLTTTRHGWLVILQRDNRAMLRRPLHVGLCVFLILVGVMMFVLGVMTGSLLFMGFAALEFITGSEALRYIYKKALAPKEWWIEHLGSLIGSGIAAYTAFFVFGGSRLLAQFLQGSFEGWSLVFWFGPGMIGGIAIGVLSRQYRRKFAPQIAAQV